MVKSVSGYAPSNVELTPANFETNLNTISAKNSMVAQVREQYDDAVENRSNLYKELRKRITKIKMSIAAQYGKRSNDYKDVVK